MTPVQIVGAAIALFSAASAAWIAICVLGQVDNVTGSLRKFAINMRDALYRMFDYDPRRDDERRREMGRIAREREFDAQADALRVAAFGSTDEFIANIQRELNRIEWERLQPGQGQRAAVLEMADKSYPHGNWDPGQ
jgi:hypothetical protein